MTMQRLIILEKFVTLPSFPKADHVLSSNPWSGVAESVTRLLDFGVLTLKDMRLSYILQSILLPHLGGLCHCTSHQSKLHQSGYTATVRTSR